MTLMIKSEAIEMATIPMSTFFLFFYIISGHLSFIHSFIHSFIRFCTTDLIPILVHPLTVPHPVTPPPHLCLHKDVPTSPTPPDL